jgi:hypothetical protein
MLPSSERVNPNQSPSFFYEQTACSSEMTFPSMVKELSMQLRNTITTKMIINLYNGKQI